MIIYTIYGHHLKSSSEKQDWYIGYTKRKVEYRWNNGKGYGESHPKFYNAIKKYGWYAFEHIIIAETDTIESALIIEEMFKRWYDSVDNGYNCFYSEKKSPSTNPEVAAKISKSMKGKANFKGKKHTKETKDKMSKSGGKSKGKKITEEHKKRISKWCNDQIRDCKGRFTGVKNGNE